VTFVVLFVLAVIWAVYLASWIRSRTEQRSVNSISSFNKHLSVLERTSPGRQSGAVGGSGGSGYLPIHGSVRRNGGMTRSEARRRRRDVLFALSGAALVTLMLTVVLGGQFLWLQLATDVVLVGYVALLLNIRRIDVERRNKVHYLAPVGPGGELDAPYLVPQSASANY
jgi:hypothetical protein